MKKSKAKTLGIISLVIIILIAGGVATVWMMFPPEKIKSLVIPQVEKVLGRKVSVDKAGLSFFPSIGVSLSDVEISNTVRSGFSAEPFVTLKRFHVQIALISLLKGTPEIGKIVIDKPQIRLEIDSAGSYNFDDLAIMAKDSTVQKKKSTAMPMLPVPITLKEFTINEGSFWYIDNKAVSQILIGKIDDHIQISMDKQLKDIKTSGNLVLSDVSVKTKDIKKPLSNLTITLSHDIGANLVEGTADIKQIRLSLQKLFLNITGSVSGLNSEPDLDLTLNSDAISISDLLAEIPVELAPVISKLKASGTADLKLALKGVVEKDKAFPVQGSLKLNDVMVKYAALPKSISGLNSDISFTENDLNVKEMGFQFGGNPVDIRASVVNFKRPLVDVAISARLNLTDIKDIIELPRGASLSGIVESDIKAKGEADPSDPSKLDVKGKTELKNVAVLWPPLVKPAIVNGVFTLSSKAIGQNISVKIGHSSMTMSAAISNYLSLIFKDSTRHHPRPSSDFKINSALLDVDEFMPPENEKSSKKSETSNAGIPLVAPLPGLDMKGTITANKVIYKGLQMNGMNMRMNVVNDIADLDLNTGFSSGQILEKIHTDLRNTSNITFNNKLTVNNVEVNDILLRFAGFLKPTNQLNKELGNLQNNLYGKINLNSDLSAHGGTSDDMMKSLNGDISAKVTNGKIANSLILKRLSGVAQKFIKIDDIKFRELNAIMHIADERVYFNKFDIQSDLAGDWDIKGDVGFDASLAMNINNRLTKATSNGVLSVQNSGKSALKGLLGNTQLGSAASGLIDQVGVPVDRDGRITVKMALGGTASDPKASFTGFGEGSASSPAVQPAAKQKVTEKIQETVTQKTREIKQEITKKVENEIQKKVEQNTSITKNQQEQLKKKAVSKLKKIF